MSEGRAITRFILRIALSVCLVAALSGFLAPSLVSAAGNRATERPATAQQQPRQMQMQPQRVVLSGVPEDLIPQVSNIWVCACDNDGCWPGCFTLASASILKYWANRGFPALWDGNENATLQRLRDMFPNLFCYNNKDDDGKPSDSGYDTLDVAKGFNLFVQERGYRFIVKPTYTPTFEQVVQEIDAGRPIIGAFGVSPWGSHAGTIIGYDTTNGRQVMIIRPNLRNKPDAELEWGKGYSEFGLVTIEPAGGDADAEVAQTSTLDIEVVVNDTDSGFTTQGAWTAYNVGFASESRYATTTDPSNLGPTEDTATARWTPDLPFDGIWEVMAWVPREDVNDEAAQVATYRITHAEGMNLIRRSQNKARPGWMPIGAFPFTRGNKGFVQLGNLTGDNPLRNVWADAVKFVWRAPLIVQGEDGGHQALIMDGQRRTIPDVQTFEALRLNPAHARQVSSVALGQYGAEELMPSVMSAWIGQYFNNALLSAPASLVKADPTLNFRWNGAAPAANMGARGFSVRWTRYLALSEGEYPFRIEAVGGVRLWVDGKLELDAWDAEPNIYQTHDKAVRLASGLHRVDIEYVNRDGNGQISLGNLPPNMPIVVDNPSLNWSTAPTVTLRWSDAGDADTISDEKPRRFFATVWHEQNNWRATSGWINETEWTLTLPADGRYLWSVLASDGTTNSDATPPREILIDRTTPWAQMMDATTAISMSAALAVAAAPINGYRLITDANGNLVVQDAPVVNVNVASNVTRAAEPALTVQTVQAVPAAPVAQTQLTPRLPQTLAPTVAALGNLPAIYLRWWGKDSPRDSGDGLRYDVQAREIVRAQTTYTFTIENKEVTRIGYELTLSGTQEITAPVILTDVAPITSVTPLVNYTPLVESQWITVATGLTQTETTFVGVPGSTYEFRVRAVDAAGNAQDWYDGYSVQAQIDPKTIIYRDYMPVVQR